MHTQSLRMFAAISVAAALAALTVPAHAQAPVTPANACPRTAAANGAPSTAIFTYDRSAPLDLRDSLEGVVNKLEVHHVSFISPRGGRATGVLYVPVEAPRGAHGRFAGMVILHGAPGDARGMGFASEPVARAGAVVLAVDAPFARRDPGKPISFTPGDSADIVQYLVDLQRAVDVLLARPDVDSARLGALGISYGGSVGALFAGVEHRLHAYVLGVADAGLLAHFSDPTGAPLGPPPGMEAAQWCRWVQALEPLEATRFVGRAAPAHLLFLWGKNDYFVHPYLAEALWRAAPATKEARWYDSGHMLPEASGADVQQWLADRIGLVPPVSFSGRVAEYLGTYIGWGKHLDALALSVVADSAGRLELRGPFTSPDDPAGRLTYLGRSSDGDVFRLDDKRLTFVRANGRITDLYLDAPIDNPQVHLVLSHVAEPRRGAGNPSTR